MKLIKSEILKLVWQRRTWGLLVAAIAIASLGTAFSPYAIEKTGITMSFSSADVIDSVYAKSLGGYMFVMILGIYAMSGEFHNHTAIATFLATPKRWKALGAKLLVAAVSGGIFNTIAALVAMGLGAYALSFYTDAVAPHSYIWVNYPASAFVTGAVLSIIGVGIGTLIRSQNAAVLTGTLWIFLLDRLLAFLFVDIGKYLPTGLITSLMNLHVDVTVKQSPISLDTSKYLEPVPALWLLLLYGVVFAGLSAITTLRRDVE